MLAIVILSRVISPHNGTEAYTEVKQGWIGRWSGAVDEWYQDGAVKFETRVGRRKWDMGTICQETVRLRITEDM